MNSQTLKYSIIVGLFAVPFTPFLVSSSLFFPFITTKAFAWRIIVEIIFALWLVLMLWDKSYRPQKSVVLYAICAFLVVVGLADLLGVAPEKSFWSNFERMEGYIAMLHLGAFFLVASSVLDAENWKRWWNTSLVASVLLALYSFKEVFGGEIRVDATFGNAAYLAVYMLFHIFIAGFYMYKSRSSTALRWWYGFAIVINTVILYYTATRGAILGLLGGALIIAFLSIFNKEDKTARRVGISTMVALAVVLVTFFGIKNTDFAQTNPVLSRFATLSFEELKTQGRYFVWPMAWEGFKERPILGYGQDNFVYTFQKYYSADMHRLEPWFDRAHNIFLDWLIAGGALGLLSYLALYLALVVLIRRDAGFSKMEKVILYGLITAYAFHNFFVFDHLASYILFFSLLAFIHSRSSGAHVFHHTLSTKQIHYLVIPVASVFLIASVYFINVKPISANLNLLQALFKMQDNALNPSASAEHFYKAYEASTLGRTEVVEQIATNAPRLLSSDISVEEKNEFFEFARTALVDHAEGHLGDARSQMITGSFLGLTSTADDALKYLYRAQELIPNKQHVYFEIGSTLLNARQYSEALEVFKYAYDLAPEYKEAQIIYLVGAIYAGDTALERQLVTEVGERITDLRIASAYNTQGRVSDVERILLQRLEENPRDIETYSSLTLLYVRSGRQSSAIALLEQLSQEMPEYKDTADEYIRQIRSGEIQ